MYVMKWEEIWRVPDVFIVYMRCVGVRLNVCIHPAQFKGCFWHLPGWNMGLSMTAVLLFQYDQ